MHKRRLGMAPYTVIAWLVLGLRCYLCLEGIRMIRKLWVLLLLLSLILIFSSLLLPRSLEFVSLTVGFFLAMLGAASK